MPFEVCEMNHIVGIAEKLARSSVTDFRHHPQAAMTNGRGAPGLVVSTE